MGVTWFASVFKILSKAMVGSVKAIMKLIWLESWGLGMTESFHQEQYFCRLQWLNVALGMIEERLKSACASVKPDSLPASLTELLPIDLHTVEI